jgi:hypothetical protein
VQEMGDMRWKVEEVIRSVGKGNRATSNAIDIPYTMLRLAIHYLYVLHVRDRFRTILLTPQLSVSLRFSGRYHGY